MYIFNRDICVTYFVFLGSILGNIFDFSLTKGGDLKCPQIPAIPCHGIPRNIAFPLLFTNRYSTPSFEFSTRTWYWHSLYLWWNSSNLAFGSKYWRLSVPSYDVIVSKEQTFSFNLSKRYEKFHQSETSLPSPVPHYVLQNRTRRVWNVFCPVLLVSTRITVDFGPKLLLQFRTLVSCFWQEKSWCAFRSTVGEVGCKG